MGDALLFLEWMTPFISNYTERQKKLKITSSERDSLKS